MKRLFILVFTLSLGQMLWAQSDIVVRSAPCKSENSMGGIFESPKNAIIEARYAPDCTTFSKKVVPGDRLAMNGCIQVPKGCMVNLLFNGKGIPLAGGRTYNLTEVTSDVVNASKMSFINRFLDYVGNAMDESKDEKSLIANHRKHMEVRAGIKGMASQQYAIKISQLLSGKVSADYLTFIWEEVENADGYLFKLYHNNNKVETVMKRIYGNVFEIDPGTVSLNPGDEYMWQVTAVMEGDSPAKSPPQSFIYDPDGATKIMTDVAQNPDFKQMAEEEKTLMYAFALEEGGYYYDAEIQFTSAMASAPENKLIRNLVAAFYSRMDMLDKAKSTIQE